MKCNICNHTASKIFEAKILNKYNIEYFYCSTCEHIQTQEPYWLNEAYASAISATDTGIMKRNLDNSIKTGAVIFNFFDMNAKYLDYAGGYGILTRLLRDAGFDFYWSDKYAKNLIANGFEYNPEDKIELISAFECFEHFLSPMAEIEKMFEISDNILFTQPVLTIPPKKPDEWWYYAKESGQHINFYSNKTLDFIAEKFNKKHLKSGEYHLFTSKDINEKDFNYTITNDTAVYAKNMNKLKSKIMEDMNKIINKINAE